MQKSLSLSLSLSPKPSLRDGEKESIGAHFLRLWADRRKGKRERATRVAEFALDMRSEYWHVWTQFNSMPLLLIFSLWRHWAVWPKLLVHKTEVKKGLFLGLIFLDGVIYLFFLYIILQFVLGFIFYPEFWVKSQF
jgi:hypothetical protein